METQSNKKIQFEDILTMIGDQGKWQIMIFMITWIECILIGCHHLSSSFLGASMDHCKRKQFAIPFDNTTDKFEFCEMYDLSSLPSMPSDFDLALSIRPDSLPRIHCEDAENVPENDFFEYDQTEGLSSIVNEWNLVCSRLPLLSTVQGSYMGGVFVGCIVFGWASDKFGRRKSIIVASVIQCGFVLVTEVCGPKYRTIFGILTQFPFGIGAALLPLIAYFLRDWFSLQLAISIPSVLLIVYFIFMPESPRWLLGEGRVDEALKILKDGAKMNNKELPSDEEMYEILTQFKNESMAENKTQEIEGPKTWKQKAYEIFKEIIILFETPEMRKRTINIFYSWLVVAMVYYGLSFNSKNLGGNRYVSTFISGFVEVPAVAFIIPALERFGRVKCYCGTFMAGGICCGLVALATFILETGEKIWIPVTFAMSGKFLISMTFAIAYLYTAELFPTPVRNVAVGAASTFARIGSMIVPYIVDLLGAAHAAIPVIIFGIVSFTAGLFSLMLPETLNKKMPESVAEVENYRKRKNHNCGEEMDSSLNQFPASGNTEENQV
ncbi:SLC22A4_5 [Lepeophtheirus salmonis]|uniref:SLC22A4_5 n=1 Tax=Lepeophtheirus salmonis TaxID=72036 RepID=A0A7R8D942_LEPSM|nr:SLC22A4_5 [Lepeophtheirus salmonis]CAF3041792.1 SLC22A4_5 [Lepeophtheirus salmonis]